MIDIKNLPAPDLKGWRVIPDVSALRSLYQKDMGQQRGTYAADALPLTGWTIVFDLRLDGLPDGFVCERPKGDGSVASVCWDARYIRSLHPPRSAPVEAA